jgi:hypothetical protein
VPHPSVVRFFHAVGGVLTATEILTRIDSAAGNKFRAFKSKGAAPVDATVNGIQDLPDGLQAARLNTLRRFLGNAS